MLKESTGQIWYMLGVTLMLVVNSELKILYRRKLIFRLFAQTSLPCFTVCSVTASFELLIKGKTSNWVYPATGLPFISKTISPWWIFPRLYLNLSCRTSPMQINSPFSAPPTMWRLKLPLEPRRSTHSWTFCDQCLPLRGKEFRKGWRFDIPGQSRSLI